MEILTAQQVVISQLLCLIILVSVQCAWEATLIGKRSIPGLSPFVLCYYSSKLQSYAYSLIVLFCIPIGQEDVFLEFKLGYFTKDWTFLF